MAIEFWKTNENPITCYISTGTPYKTDSVKKPRAGTGNSQRVPIMVEYTNGTLEEYGSVVLAAKALSVKESSLYAYLNGHGKNPTEYKIYKSTKNK